MLPPKDVGYLMNIDPFELHVASDRDGCIRVHGLSGVISGCIQEFGGRKELAEFLGFPEAAIKNWQRGNAPAPLFVIEELLPFIKINEIQNQGTIRTTLLDMVQFFTVKRSKHKIQLPRKIDEKIAYFVGLIVGDGHLAGHEKIVNGAWTIHFCNGDGRFVKRIYAPLVADLFGISPSVRKIVRIDGRSYFEVSFASKVVHRLLTNIFQLPAGMKCDKVKMPQILKSSAPEIRASFLRGIFDTDGSVVGNKIKFATTSRWLCRDIVTELENLGFFPKVYEWIKGEKYLKLFEVRLVRQKDILRFYALISPLHPKKAKLIRKITLNFN
jgi:intein/homing endonuclease